MIVVYAYVCGDILHKGHLLHLENCKAMGDKLIVGVLTDEAVMEKKPKPSMGFDERLDLIKALKCVDVAIPQNIYSPCENILNIKPNIMAESESHSDELIEHVTNVTSSINGRVVIMPYYKNQSSTKIKETVKNG